MTTTLQSYPLLGEAQRLSDDSKWEQAAQAAMEHLRRHPNEPRGMALLGYVAMRLGALEQAQHFMRRAIAAGHAPIELRRNLASVLSQQERLKVAEPMVAGLVAETRDPALMGVHANILERLGENARALSLHEQLVKAHPDKPHLWVAYGHALRAAGRVDDAVAAYRRATEVDPEYGEGWWGLAGIRKKVLTDADIAAMHEQAAIAVDVRNEAPINFALARAYAERGRHEDAFKHYEIANRLRAETLQYDPAELSDEISEIERTVDRDYIERLPSTPLGDDVPVFIVSLPRSGSTLLEQMLGSHPDVEPIGELPYAPAILRSFIELATRRGAITVPQALAAMSDEQAALFGRDYLERAALHRKTGRRWFVDKLPNNWSNVLFIRRILPQARFVDIRRPAMDCCFSNFSQSFTSAHASSFTLEHIGQCYSDYVRLMDHLDDVAPGMVHHVSYEKLVAGPRGQLEPLLAYLGLPWDDRVLEFHKLDRVVRTPSSEQVRRPLNRDGMEVWRPYSQWLGPLREALGPLADG